MSTQVILAVLLTLVVALASGTTPSSASTQEQYASGFSCSKCFWEEIDRQGIKTSA